MRSIEEILSLYLDGEAGDLELEEVAKVLHEFRSLVKFPAWVALGKVKGLQEETIMSREPVFADARGPIVRVLEDEYKKGLVDGAARFMNLPELWVQDLEREQETRGKSDD